MLIALLSLHAVAGFGALVGARRLGRHAMLLGAVAPLAVVAWAVAEGSGIIDGDAVTSSTSWVSGLGLTIDLRADAFSLLMVVLVSGIGALVLAYGHRYFSHSNRAGRVAGLLTLFAGAMLGVVLADNLLLLYVCWELTSITSYLLIGIDDAEAESRAAALHALLVTAAGGLAMLGGFVLIGQAAGTFRLSEILADPPGGAATSVALVLVLAGAFTKSAQYPFQGWLPGAMVAPTPISAYLHSAAMVKAGVYLVARFAPAFAAVGIWRPLVLGVGLVTMVAGGLRALRPWDLKQILAYGTISQLGFLIVLFGIGLPEATAAGAALILAHGLFKAALFMVVGIVDHEAHTRDLRRLPVFREGWTPTKVVAVVSAASMAAVAPLAGFIAKEKAYDALLHGTTNDRLVLAGIVAGSVLTVAYSLRIVAALLRPDWVARPTEPRPSSPHAPAAAFLAPAAALAVATVLLGLAPVLWSDLVDAGARALDADAKAELKLWHGVNTALVLSLLTLAAGGAVFAARWGLREVQDRLALPWTARQAFDGLVAGLLRVARRITGVVQSGSLPIYAAVVLTTAAVAPLTALLLGDWWGGWPDLVDEGAQVPIAAVLIGGAVAATLVTRRFAAALLLGIVGYGMAALFVAHGAPDLALTQFAVETLSVVVFLLVLRRLPDRFERRTPALGPPLRIGVSVLVGALVLVMALATHGARTEPPISTEMSERALPDGDGRNIVNVILVDIRGLDTLGEITVLAVAGIGITALARAGRTPAPLVRRRRRWLGDR